MQQAFGNDAGGFRLQSLRGKIGVQPIGVPGPDQRVILAPDYILTGVGVRAPLPDLKAQRRRTLRPRNVLEIESAETVKRTAEHPLCGAQPVRRRDGGAEPLAKTPDRELRKRRLAQEGEEARSHSEPTKLHWS